MNWGPYLSKNDEVMRTAQCYEEASAWIARLDKGLSAADFCSLREWLAVDGKNRTVLLELACLWDRMSVLSRYPQGLFDSDDENNSVTGLKAD
ncbi:hypothetical protein BA177_07105 [Woeseia oceani]|uniref:FecR N-terminal domain-containing protein n=1 Tax=Woeseia oceani TaxID=1548547 RepID=A0A193LES2_9GAMM|nr:hypothetical protein BA177_07105 [Woeseia oceani]